MRPLDSGAVSDTRHRLSRVRLVAVRRGGEENRQWGAGSGQAKREQGAVDTLTPHTYEVREEEARKKQRAWRTVLGSRWMQGAAGLLVGVSLLVAMTRFVDISATLRIVQRNVTSPQGMVLVLLASAAFLLAFSFRALRWRLFLNSVGKVGPWKVIQLFLIGVFLNFILPIRAGELAKSLVLKRVYSIPISQSLPTIAMDKAMDLLPALAVIVLAPFLGLQLAQPFWFVLGLANIGIFGLVLFIVLTAWKRPLAHKVLRTTTIPFPAGLRKKAEGFVIGFVDALLLCASKPRRLLWAILLTALGVACDGLYNYFAFWTVGHAISYTEAIFGYMVFNLFYILPNPPGQVGSNEVVGLLIFSGLLHIPAESVTAMIVFFHSWSGVLMCVLGIACLSAFGISLSGAMKLQPADN